MGRKILPPTFFFIFMLLSILFHFIFPIVKIVYPPYTYLGFILILFGGVINIWADLLLKKNRTTVKPYEKPTSLVTSGPYRISRNPQYLGFTAILLGVVINHGTLSMFIFPVLFVVVIEIMFIPKEEENLKKVFGEKYQNYTETVRRWI